MDFIKLLYPGIGIKRWLFLSICGVILVGVGMAIIGNTSVFGFLENRIKTDLLSITNDQYFLSGLMLVIIGVAFLIISFKKLVRFFIRIIYPEFENIKPIGIQKEVVLKKGPKIVVIGGGTGLSVLLKGLKEFTGNITAVVSMADDGGSSGRIRDQLGMLPPGDVRNCMVALANREASMEQLFNYRFQEGKDLKGHNLGNLMLVALTEMYGSFEVAVKQMSKVLAICGKVLPSTLENVGLVAELVDGSIISGESNVSKADKPLRRIRIEPENPKPFKDALEAIEEADMIVLGPGSLYTSIIPNLLVRDIPKTIRKSKAMKVYICNVMTQPKETENYSVSKHIKVISEHGGKGLIDYVLVNNQIIKDKELLKKYRAEGARPVEIDYHKISKMGIKVIAKRLIDETDLVRHNPRLLGIAIMELFIKRKKLNFIEKLIFKEKLKNRE